MTAPTSKVATDLKQVAKEAIEFAKRPLTVLEIMKVSQEDLGYTFANKNAKGAMRNALTRGAKATEMFYSPEQLHYDLTANREQAVTAKPTETLKVEDVKLEPEKVTPATDVSKVTDETVASTEKDAVQQPRTKDEIVANIRKLKSAIMAAELSDDLYYTNGNKQRDDAVLSALLDEYIAAGYGEYSDADDNAGSDNSASDDGGNSDGNGDESDSTATADTDISDTTAEDLNTSNKVDEDFSDAVANLASKYCDDIESGKITETPVISIKDNATVIVTVAGRETDTGISIQGVEHENVKHTITTSNEFLRRSIRTVRDDSNVRDELLLVKNTAANLGIPAREVIEKRLTGTDYDELMNEKVAGSIKDPNEEEELDIETINELLRADICVVSVDDDTTIGEIRATLMSGEIQSETSETEMRSDLDADTVLLWDLDSEDWRMFPLEKIVAVKSCDDF